MIIIAGLGNPGKKYDDTRHNIGFAVIDKLAQDVSHEPVSFQHEKKFKSDVTRAGDLILMKPRTYMNASGEALAPAMNYYKITPSKVWIIHDDLDLPLGKIRIRNRGGSGGHKGVQSILEKLGSDDFVRFRLGIGRGKTSHASGKRTRQRRAVMEFVLSTFQRGEAGKMRRLIKQGSEAVRFALEHGVDGSMNRYN